MLKVIDCSPSMLCKSPAKIWLFPLKTNQNAAKTPRDLAQPVRLQVRCLVTRLYATPMDTDF